MLKLLLPVVALLAVGGAAAGVAVYLANGGETSDEVAPSSLTQVTPTSTPAPTETPTPTPTPDGWTTYQDAELGFSFPHPQGLTVSEQVFDLPEKKGSPPVRQRSVLFRDGGGVFVIGIAIVPNPINLPLEEWVGAYTGWPSEPQAVTIGGQPGLLLPINAMGDRWPAIYFRHGGHVLSLGGNVYGAAGAPPLPPGISQGDFQRVIDGFSFGP